MNNKKELAKFIKNSIKTLTTSDFTCCKYDLDNQLAVFVGWLDGYDENDKDIYHDPKNKSWCLNVAIKIKNDFYWCDFDWLNMPTFAGDSEIYDTTTTLYKNDDLTKIANYLLKSYKDIIDLKNKGLIKL